MCRFHRWKQEELDAMDARVANNSTDMIAARGRRDVLGGEEEKPTTRGGARGGPRPRR